MGSSYLIDDRAILIACPSRYGLWEIWDVQVLGRQWMVWYAALVRPASQMLIHPAVAVFLRRV
jgi:hypothetical protein